MRGWGRTAGFGLEWRSGGRGGGGGSERDEWEVELEGGCVGWWGVTFRVRHTGKVNVNTIDRQTRCVIFSWQLTIMSCTSYPDALARLVAEAAAIRVVGATEGLFGDGAWSRPMVAIQRVPNHQASNRNIPIIFVSRFPKGTRVGGRGQAFMGLERTEGRKRGRMLRRSGCVKVS